MHSSTMVKLPTAEQPTMSSLEMVDYINAERKAKAEAEGLKFPCKKYRKLEHRSFMNKVPKVLGDAAAKFFATDSYINGTGGKVERDICNFRDCSPPALGEGLRRILLKGDDK